jgi:hypothetical protein
MTPGYEEKLKGSRVTDTLLEGSDVLSALKGFLPGDKNFSIGRYFEC